MRAFVEDVRAAAEPLVPPWGLNRPPIFARVPDEPRPLPLVLPDDDQGLHPDLIDATGVNLLADASPELSGLKKLAATM